jgi:uncharacterized metal-binding protein
MPSGKVHNAVTLLTAFYTATLAPVYLPHTGASGLALIPGCLTGLLVGPDLDVDEGNKSYGIMRELGCIPGTVWKVVWWPYSFIPHRHWLSHMPIISTALRVMWLALITFGFAGQILWLVQEPVFWWYVAGLALADAHHWFLDTVVKSDGRRYVRHY